MHLSPKSLTLLSFVNQFLVLFPSTLNGDQVMRACEAYQYRPTRRPVSSALHCTDLTHSLVVGVDIPSVVTSVRANPGVNAYAGSSENGRPRARTEEFYQTLDRLCGGQQCGGIGSIGGDVWDRDSHGNVPAASSWFGINPTSGTKLSRACSHTMSPKSVRSKSSGPIHPTPLNPMQELHADSLRSLLYARRSQKRGQSTPVFVSTNEPTRSDESIRRR